MRKLILKMSMSVDGFVGGPNGEIDWLLRNMDDSAARWTLDIISQAGVHIMGSRTFHDMSAYWPYSKEPFAAPMNAIPKVVFTKKGLTGVANAASTTAAFKDAAALNPLQKAPVANANEESWINAGVASGDLTEEINKLKQQPGKDILAHGGASFAQSLAKAGLIDEYHLLVHPVALGKGLPLFSALLKPVDLKLIDTTLFKKGSMAHIYRPA